MRAAGSNMAMHSLQRYAPLRHRVAKCRNSSTNARVRRPPRGIWLGAMQASSRVWPRGAPPVAPLNRSSGFAVRGQMGQTGTMTDSSKEPSGAAPEVGEATHLGLMRQLGMMIKALRSSPAAKALVLLIAAPIFIMVVLLIAGSLLVLNVAQRWLTEMLKLKLRAGLVHDLLQDWMLPRRAFWLANAGGPMGVNPDQRMHEDARKLCELSADLGTGLVQATIMFVIFAGVLWVISRDFSFRIANRDYAVPGFMVWAAVIYASAGSLLSYWVGRSLINRNSERYAREADLRF